MKRAAPPALLLRKIVQKLGLHPDDRDHVEVDLTGHRALVVATNLRCSTSASPRASLRAN